MTRVLTIGANTIDGAQYGGAGTNYLIRDNSGKVWLVFIDRLADVFQTYSETNGIDWTNPLSMFTGTATGLSTWYGRWSNLADDKIYCAYTDSVNADILFRTIDTSVGGGTLGTQTTVFNGASAVFPAGALSICVDRGGHIRVVGSIDAGAEDGAWSSTDGGATWADTIADPSEGATQDQYLLMPGWNADTHDMMLFFWDASANEISVKRYDDSADTWTETSIATSMVDFTAGNGFPNYAACVDIVNSQNILVAWSNTDTLNAKLRLWTVNDTTVTEKTNVVSASTDDQGLCGVGLDTDTGAIYVFYGGKTDGSETFPSAINIYYKTSTDGGTTWGSETLLTSDARGILWLTCTPRFATTWNVAISNDIATDNILVSAPFPVGGGPLTDGRLVQS